MTKKLSPLIRELVFHPESDSYHLQYDQQPILEPCVDVTNNIMHEENFRSRVRDTLPFLKFFKVKDDVIVNISACSIIKFTSTDNKILFYYPSGSCKTVHDVSKTTWSLLQHNAIQSLGFVPFDDETLVIPYDLMSINFDSKEKIVYFYLSDIRSASLTHADYEHYSRLASFLTRSECAEIPKADVVPEINDCDLL